MSHQDWEPIILRPKYVQKPQTEHKPQPVSNTLKVENKVDEGDLSVNRVSHNVKLEIQKARLAKGLTQEQLANKCNMPVATVRSYENGTAIPLAHQLSKLRKVLGVPLN